MASAVGGFAGAVSRHWTIYHEGTRHTLELHHNTVLGTRSLSINGCDVPGSQGSFYVTSGPQSIVFHLGNGEEKERGKVDMWAAKGSVYYQCTFRNEVVPEDFLTAPEKVEEPGGERGYKSRVPEYVAGWDENGQAVTWYKLVTMQSDGKGTVVHRRFRDFFNVNGSIKAALKGTHLFDKVPELPPRKSMFTSHFDPAFLEERRRGLELYMQRLLAIPRITWNNDLLAHIGIIDDVREISVFFQSRSLGLALEDNKHGVRIEDFVEAEGNPSPAKQTGVLEAGNRVSKVNGEDVIGQGFNVVVAKLKSAKRPVCVHFIGYLKELQDSEVEAVQPRSELAQEFGNTERQPHAAAQGGATHNADGDDEGSDFDD
eukprot:gb/GECG01002045.1/.p1 GENE.gb/GECG01002045.1/~~gb/GECG01002045.1/.p1  ORF type:complete len:372 (+),score=44.28 gb/GECG01002045.1/:1-1116(+)